MEEESLLPTLVTSHVYPGTCIQLILYDSFMPTTNLSNQ
jgi:hypothetical protein